MTRTVLLNCPITAEIRAVDSHAIRFENFVMVMIKEIIIIIIIIIIIKYKNEVLRRKLPTHQAYQTKQAHSMAKGDCSLMAFGANNFICCLMLS